MRESGKTNFRFPFILQSDDTNFRSRCKERNKLQKELESDIDRTEGETFSLVD